MKIMIILTACLTLKKYGHAVSLAQDT